MKIGKIIVADCEHCGGRWWVSWIVDDPAVLEGICLDCQEDSDVERPLRFGYDEPAYGYPLLSKRWVST